jgi:RNA polymerase sigma-70 factor (ECF subfamily)
LTILQIALDEKQLVAGLSDARSRERAFRTLVAEYGPLLHRHLLRMLSSPADVDDVLQNTFVKVFRSIDRFRGDAKLSTWLYRIATNVALNWLRSKKRREKSFTNEEPQRLAESMLRADPYFDGDEAQAQLLLAMKSLPEKQRMVFSLRYFDDLPYREISQITDTSEGALKASYHLAAKKIEEILKAYVQQR